jgi:putative transposase
MVERGNRITRTSGMSTWRAGCSGTGTSGSEGGSEKPTSRKAGRALRPDPYTEHPTREGKLYCAVVLDAYSRRVVGWSIDATPTATLVTNALGMAIQTRTPPAGAIIHSDQGVHPVRLLGVHPAGQELGPGALDGLGRGLL